MGSKTKQVGGSPTGQAFSDQYTNFLSQLLGGGGGGGFGFGGGGAGYVGRPSGSSAMSGTAGNMAAFYNNLLRGGANPNIPDINLNMDTSMFDPTKAQAAYSNLFQQQNTQDINSLRARYGAAGGMGFGTPAASAEALFRAQSAPREALGLEDIIQQRVRALQGTQGLMLQQRGQDINSALQGTQLQLQGLSPLLAGMQDIYNRNVPQAQIIQQKSFLGNLASGIGAIAAPVASMFAPGFNSGGGGGGGLSPMATIDTNSWMNDPNQLALAGGYRPPILPVGNP